MGNNEDWLDSWSYLDANSNPISLAGITINFMMRVTATDPVVYVSASTASTINGSPVSGTLTIGGTGSNIVALNVPRSILLHIPPGSYVWEAQGVAEETVTIGTGTVTVTSGIVR